MTENASLSDIKFQDRNPNTGTNRGSQIIEQSIQEFGFADAGTLDKNNTIIGGNQRTAAAQKLGMDGAVIIDVDGTKPVFIRRLDLDLNDPDNDKAKRLAYALNRSQELSLHWDSSILAQDAEQGIDLSSYFLSEELAELTKSKGDDDGSLKGFEPQPTSDILYRVVIDGLTSQDDAQKIANNFGGSKIEKYRV